MSHSPVLSMIFSMLALGAVSANGQASTENLYVACDNGTRCVTAPCASLDAFDLTTGEFHAGVDVDAATLGDADASGLFDGTAVFLGRLQAEEDAGPPTILVSRIERPATPAETRLCTG